MSYERIGRQIGVSYITMILTSVLGAISIFILTRGLSVAEYGVYALLASTVQICGVVFDLGLSQYILTKIPGREFGERTKEFFNIYILDIIVYVLIFLVYAIFESQILQWLKLQNYVFEFRLTMFIAFLTSLLRYHSDFFAAEKRIGLKNMVIFLQKSVWIILLAAVYIVFYGFNIRTVVILWTIGIVFAWLFSIEKMKHHINAFYKYGKIGFSTIKKALVFSIPLVPFLIGGWLIAVSDKYILNYYWSSEEVGIYALAYSLLTIINSFAATIATVLYPYIAESYNQAKDHNLLFNASLKYSLMFVLPGVSLMFFMREQIITLVSGVKYLPGASVIAILFLYPVFGVVNTLLYQDMLLREKTKMIGVTYVVGAVVSIIMNLLLIPKYGMNGAAITTLVSYLLMFIMMWKNCFGHVKLYFGFLRLSRIVLASFVIGMIAYFLNPEVLSMKIIVIALSLLLYLALMFLLGIFDKKEMSALGGMLHKVIKTFLYKTKTRSLK